MVLRRSKDSAKDVRKIFVAFKTYWQTADFSWYQHADDTIHDAPLAHLQI
jgi:hypothetical protein